MERVRSLLRSDRLLMLRMISSELNLNWFTIHQILTQGFGHEKSVRQDGTKEPHDRAEANWRDVCLDLLDRPEREPEFFSCIIAGDESWILEKDPETKCQSRKWHTANSPRPKKARMSKSKIKSMLICFLTVRGSSTRNLCHLDKLSIKLFIRKSLKDSGKGWHISDEALHAHGCCTMTMPNVTLQSPTINF